MARPYIGTPATHVSINSDGFDDLDNLGMEPSFVAPDRRDVFQKGRSALRTPADARGPLQLLPNGNRAQGRAEFTPLLKSVAKTNISKRLTASARRRGTSNTPGPALPALDETNLASEHTNSSIGRNDYTPMPQHMSSSVASTPLAQLPGRDGAVVNEGNMMTLREQEGIIDKIEKENFGLKMKIHFLEENLSKRGGEFNQAALKENTDLKVNRVTLQKELHKYKKTIVQAERDAELYKRQLEEYRERVRQKKADETFKLELANAKSDLEEKDAELLQLRAKYEKLRSGNDDEVEKLRDEVGDLQADLRERDRQLDEREEEIEVLKSNASQENNAVADLQDELDSAKQEIEDLKDDLEKATEAVKEAKAEQETAEDEQRRAEEQLHDLQDDVANKSILPSGLSKQLEERAAKFEEDYYDLKVKFQALQQNLDAQSLREREMQERLRAVDREGSSDLRHTQQELESANLKCEALERKYTSMVRQYESVHKELSIKTDEKDLLQTRHDALTTESAQLQNDLLTARKSMSDVQEQLDAEKQKAAQNDSHLRLLHRNEMDHLTDQIDSLHRDVSTRDEKHAAEAEAWAAERRTINAAKSRAEEKADGLQRTVDKLNDAQGTMSGREMRLQEALDSEKQRHLQEEKVLVRQIQELNEDIAGKRSAADTARMELNNAKEELRISIRDQAQLKERVAELEDDLDLFKAEALQKQDVPHQGQADSQSDSEVHVSKLKKEKLDLLETLAGVRRELENAKRAVQTAEQERDEIEARLDNFQRPQDDTFDAQQERREFKRERQRLDKEVETLRQDKEALAQTNKELEEELDAEIERAATEEHKLTLELNELRNKQLFSRDSKEKELASAKSKVHRLETRIRDLEDMLESQTRASAPASPNASMLKHELEDARKNETAAAKREADLKAANRNMKMQMNDLERQLHEARLAELKAKSPASSVSSHGTREANELRQEIFDARAELKTLRDENQQLKRATANSSQEETQYALLHAQLESKADELVEFELRLRNQNKLVEILKKDLARLRTERDEARQDTRISERTSTVDLRNELKRLRAERDEARDMSVQIAGKSKDALVLKSELMRLREQKSQAAKRAQTVEQELDLVQAQYESILERFTSGPSSDDATSEKYIRGLMKEILWLKARLRREERLRNDLAWSKTYLQNGEAMRKQCNQVDLRILREMGVSLDGKRYQKMLAPIQKFKAGIHCVIAAIRLNNMKDNWREARKIGDSLRLARKG